MKRRLITIILALALCLALVPAAAATGDERGVMTFERTIAPQYEDAGLFSEDLVAVKQGGKWGYIDLNNNIVIGFQYDYASFFSEGYAVVGSFGTNTYHDWVWDGDAEDWVPEDVEYEVIFLGRIDKSGNYRPFRRTYFNRAGPTEEDIGLVTNDLNFGTAWFDQTQLYYYYNGWANVNDSNIFDTDGNQFKTVNDERYRARYAPTEGLVAAWDDDFQLDGAGAIYLNLDGSVAIDLRGHKYYDGNGNMIVDTLVGWDSVDWDQVEYSRYFYNVFPFNQGIAPVWLFEYSYNTDETSILLGFIDKSGQFVIQPQYSPGWIRGLRGEHVIFNDGGLASVRRGSDFGAINIDGGEVIQFQYDGLRIFTEGVAPFERGGLFGYVDIAGNEVIPARFRETSGFSNGVAVAYDGTRAFLIDRSGNEIPGSEGVNLAIYIIHNEDGTIITYNPGEYITITEGGLYGFGRITYVPDLPDPSEMDSWAYEEVISAIEEDLVPVPLQNMFRSDITRRDFSRLIIHALGTILVTERDDLVYERTGRSLDSWAGDSKFNDTTDRDVIAAEALGVVTGYDEGGVFTFRPHNHISRQEAAVMLWRAARILGMDTESTPLVSDFVDRDSLASWSVTQVDYVYSVGIMRGVGDSFDAVGHYTRQQSFMTIYRLLLSMSAEG